MANGTLKLAFGEQDDDDDDDGDYDSSVYLFKMQFNSPAAFVCFLRSFSFEI